jgi:hypothetical protein
MSDDGTFVAVYPDGRRVRLRWPKEMAKQLDDQEYSIVTGASYPRGRLFSDVLEDLDDEDERDDDDDDDDVEKQADHHASVVADLLVEAGSFPHRTAALHHLLRKPGGQALLARLHKAAKTEKESSTMDSIHSIMKSAGIAATCAVIVAKGSTTISQDELVAAVSTVAHERWPQLTEAQAFDKVYSDRGEEGRVLRQAIDVAKAMPFVADLAPLVVGGVDAMHAAVSDTESSEAYAQLQQIGRDRWPTASEAQQFANAFADPKNAALAAKAHRRPAATTFYPMPR